MSDRAIHRFDVDSRVQTFGKDHTADFAAGSKAAGHFAALAQTITDLDTAKAGQDGGTATAKAVLFDALRLDLQNIARTARAIAETQPGFADKYRLPDNPSQTALLTTADAVVQELAQPGIPAKFLAYEMPADFVQDLKDDLVAIRSADDDMESDDQSGVASTAAVGRLIRAGMAEVTQLDAIIKNKYARTPDKLRAWQSASHIERAPQREKKPAPANCGTTPPAPPK